MASAGLVPISSRFGRKASRNHSGKLAVVAGTASRQRGSRRGRPAFTLARGALAKARVPRPFEQQTTLVDRKNGVTAGT
jgi:hypothetical protein